MDSHINNKKSFKWKYQNKEISITLEFPEHPAPQAVTEFIAGLKEIYLRKIQKGAIQKHGSALPSSTTKEKEDTIND